MRTQKKQKIIIVFFLSAISLLSGCATTRLWNERSAPGAYQEKNVKLNSLRSMYIMRSSEGVTFLVPGHPDKQNIFTMTVPEYTNDIERFLENYSNRDQLITVRGVKMMVGLYNGKGYRVDIDFNSILPTNRVVELFAGSGVASEEEYQRVMHEGDFNFHISYKLLGYAKKGGRNNVSHYTYSMSDRKAKVKAGVVPISDEYGLLAKANYMPMRRQVENFAYSVYEYRYENDIPVVIKFAGTPVTVAFDAVTTVVGTVVGVPYTIYLLSTGKFPIH